MFIQYIILKSNYQVIGKIMKKMVKVNIDGQMETSIKVLLFNYNQYDYLYIQILKTIYYIAIILLGHWKNNKRDGEGE